MSNAENPTAFLSILLNEGIYKLPEDAATETAQTEAEPNVVERQVQTEAKADDSPPEPLPEKIGEPTVIFCLAENKQELPDNDIAYLHKIMAAAGQREQQYRLMVVDTLPEQPEQLKPVTTYTLCFGKDWPQAPFGQVIRLPDTELLCSPTLSAIQQSVTERKRLWAAIQVLFDAA